jgi:hypothetical protein
MSTRTEEDEYVNTQADIVALLVGIVLCPRYDNAHVSPQIFEPHKYPTVDTLTDTPHHDALV